MPHLTVAERLAAADRDFTLAAIADQSEWDRFLVEQAILAVGETRDTFSANDLRTLLPEMGHGYLGAAIKALQAGGIIRPTGAMVPSTSPATKGHRLTVWTLTARGHAIAAHRRTAHTGRAA
ncbi:hypothetical protein [Streptomyces jumonjinensis]|uniref:MarR family transcriptional regulator n=1 Tax=Streptomyces jumonjinensis TaxID=1945 RepID=A0A646KM60_STRJU|nr:hypothetical protein [Streptomyces jumonjinensis]MQT03127.1 hypothetical protein [Streptomyces jumonjinensis]